MDYTLTLKNSTNIYKNNFLKKIKFIPKYEKKSERVYNILSKNNIHNEDKYIILDISDFNKKTTIKLIFVSLDKQFTTSLKKCNLEFLKDIWNINEIKNRINKH